MKRIAMISCLLLIQSTLAFAGDVEATVKPTATLKCKIVETLRDPAGIKYKQQSYLVQSAVSNADRQSQIVVDSKFVPDFNVDLFGCPGCASTDSVHHPEINATLTEKTSGAKAFATFNDFGTGMLTVGAKTVAYICNLVM